VAVRDEGNVKHTSLRVCEEHFISDLNTTGAINGVTVTYPQVGEYDAMNR
jgi:hypothetical protein